jgi:hypothetical protein
MSMHQVVRELNEELRTCCRGGHVSPPFFFFGFDMWIGAGFGLRGKKLPRATASQNSSLGVVCDL